ncbi:MAG: ABC transporter permease [Chloroflexota bacterium]|nr:ABC transporter permease [Chloroflexota bacterium]
MTRESGWRDFVRQASYQLLRNPLVVFGLVVIAAWLLIALVAPLIAPREPLAQNVNVRLQAPSADYRFGTDDLGRDVFSRVLHGARLTIPAGIAVVVIGSIIGTLIGGIAGYLGGFWDEALMRITELFMAFPTIILALAITAALGPDIRNAIVALVIVWWPQYARLVRGLVLEVKTQEYVTAVKSVGARGSYTLFRTIIPNCIAPAIILATLDVGTAILTFAGLSFLGLGADPSSAEWGRMVSIGIDFFNQWWMWLFPGLAIASLVLAFNFVGDGLRDLLDPRMRKR